METQQSWDFNDLTSSFLPSNTDCEFEDGVYDQSFVNNYLGNPTQPDFIDSSLLQLESIVFDQPSLDFSKIVSITNQTVEPLRIIAQPKKMYRERYASETDETRNRLPRFIRVEEGHPDNLEYPTVEIPAIWRNSNKLFYIRVTLVTVSNDKAPVVCIHPYGIDTNDTGVIKYPESPSQFENNNEHYYHSLYYPVSFEELCRGRKSFRIIRKKMRQDHLENYGPLQVNDSDDKDVGRIKNTSNPKEVINTYQLWRSKLVFTLFECMSNNILQLMSTTSVMSEMMCDEKIELKNSLVNRSSSPGNENNIRYSPVEGNWNGGDEVLMSIPKLDRRKALYLYFDYGQQGRQQTIAFDLVDTKTISFYTPACPLLRQNHDADASIVGFQNGTVIFQVNFRYLIHQNNGSRFFCFKS